MPKGEIVKTDLVVKGHRLKRLVLGTIRRKKLLNKMQPLKTIEWRKNQVLCWCAQNFVKVEDNKRDE